jgi:hypothetical protein
MPISHPQLSEPHDGFGRGDADHQPTDPLARCKRGSAAAGKAATGGLRSRQGVVTGVKRGGQAAVVGLNQEHTTTTSMGEVGH